MDIKYPKNNSGEWVGQSNNYFKPELFDNITFDWEELHGKNLLISVVKSEGITLVAGKDLSTNKIYILQEERSFAICQKDLFFCNDLNRPIFTNGRKYLFQTNVLNVDVWDNKERRNVFSHEEFMEYFKIQ